METYTITRVVEDYIPNHHNMQDKKQTTIDNNKRKHPERFRAVDVLSTGQYYRDENDCIRKRKIRR